MIDRAERLPEQYGYIDIHTKNASFVDFEFSLPGGGQAAFYNNIGELVERFSGVSKGVLPDSFYLIEENWSPFDDDSNESFERLRDICCLINWLAELSVSVDDESSPYYNNLFFAIPSTEGRAPKTFVVKTKLTSEVIGYHLRHVKLVEALVDPKHEGKLHIEERRMIFQLSLADVLSQHGLESDSLLSVVKHWDQIILGYWKNLQSYVHGFSFDKIRVEVANAEVEYSTKLSSSLGDIAGKLLALPVSLAALPYLSKSEDKFQFSVISLGLFMVSTIILCMVVNQWIIVSRLRASFDVVFEQLKEKLLGYPKSLRLVLSKTLKNVDRQSNLLFVTFVLFIVISFVPIGGVIYLADERYAVLSVIYSKILTFLDFL
ncbi:hypothetical protein [uncultured Halomonas sp.]|uniref:hypothetical protein n=1 Tax=uncultured Halomonas sp. TaxID=173971 RepID=UPI00262E90AD|nr:hypothetical protein [uncultured Halomonas sp.]